MKFYHITNNFTAGEWSPKMLARTDVQQYLSAAKSLLNSFVLIQGGAYRRPGSIHVDLSDYPAAEATLNSALAFKLIPYYVGDFRFLIVAVDGTIDDWFVIDPNGIVTSLDNRSHPGLVTATIFADEIEELQYIQTGDTLIITIGGGRLAPLVILSPNSNDLYLFSWCVATNGLGYLSYAEYVKQLKWEAVPYSKFENNRTRGDLVVAGGMTVGSAVTVTFPNDQFGFAHTLDFPVYVRITAAAKTAVLELTVATSATVGTGTVMYNPDSVAAGTFGTTAGTFWESSLWVEDFPKCVTAFEQRLYFAAIDEQPETVWGSTIGNIVRFMRVPYVQDAGFASYTSDNSYPFEFTLASKYTSRIVALSAAKSLVINTDLSEAVAYTSNGNALGALNIALDMSTSYGSKRVQPIRVNNFLTFVQKNGRKVRDLAFSFEQDQYKSSDLTFVSDHLTLGDTAADAIKELTKIEDPSSILFARTADGKLLSCTLDRDYQINAWTPLVMGGTDSKVLAITTFASTNSFSTKTNDDVYMVVERTIDGDTVRHIEYLAPIYELVDTAPGTYDYLPIYVDAVGFSSLGGLGSTIVDGLDHLEGETVDCIADGRFMGSFVVSGGTIDIGYTYTTGYAGLPYTSIIQPTSVEAGMQLGSSVGVLKRVDELTVRVWNSYGFEYGISLDDMREVDFRDQQAPMNAAVQLVTADFKVNMPPSYAGKAEIIIRQRKPWPCNILAVVARGITYE